MGMLKTLRRGALLAGLGMAGGAAVITVRHLLDTPQPLSSGLPGEARIDRRHGGDLYYTVAGPTNAQPMVLLHDFYPGASNFEYRAVFSALADRYRVYAPDWLGFGMSERLNIAYTGEFYARMLTGFVRDVVARPVIVVAHGLAANIAVRAAADTPALFERLILVSPDDMAGMREAPTIGQTLIRATQRAMLGLVPYALLSTKPALRWLSRGRSRLDVEAASEDLHHRYASAHQFGGQHAALALLTGELDLPIRHVFPLLEQPSLIISGEDDRRHLPEEMEDLAVLSPRADLDVLPGIGAAILEEQSNEFLHFVDRWLSTPVSSAMADEPALVGAASPGHESAELENLDTLGDNEDVTPEAETSYQLHADENSAPLHATENDTWPDVPMDEEALRHPNKLGKAETDPQLGALAEENQQAQAEEAPTPTDTAAETRSTRTIPIETPQDVNTSEDIATPAETITTPSDNEIVTPEEAVARPDEEPQGDDEMLAGDLDVLGADEQEEQAAAVQEESAKAGDAPAQPPASRAARRNDNASASTRVPLTPRSGGTARSRSASRTSSTSSTASAKSKRSSTTKRKNAENTGSSGK